MDHAARYRPEPSSPHGRWFPTRTASIRGHAMISCQLAFPHALPIQPMSVLTPWRRRSDAPRERRPVIARDADDAVIETDIAARLDRLPWDRFHTRVVVALGITWILDGLEVTLAGALAGALKSSPLLRFSNPHVRIPAPAYPFGAVPRAPLFRWP